MIHQNDPLGHYHCFTGSWRFPQKTGGELKFVLPSFPARVARSEPHWWVVWLWLFGQVCPTPVQWDLSLLIALAKTTVEGRAVLLCLSCKSEFESHWVPHSIGLVPHRNKELRKLLFLFAFNVSLSEFTYMI